MIPRFEGVVARLQVGALRLVMICFLASGLIRLAGFAPALAQQLDGVPSADNPVETAMAMADCPVPAEPDALLLAIRERDAQLDSREQRLAQRLEVFTVATEEFERRRDALIAAEERLAATLAIADQAAENDIRQITAVYENMKPKDAAEVFDTMDQTFAAGFLIRMNPQAAADILSNMEAETAYAVSLLMASRNVGAPTE